MTVTRYVLTYVNKNGMRTLVGPAQGRYTYEKPSQAMEALKALMEGNSWERLAELYGDPDKMGVRPCECWDNHFDPVGVWFDD